MNINKLRKYKIFKKQKLLKLKLLKTQGLCNINYKLQSLEKDYLIRTFKHKHNDKKRRRKEFYIQNKASKLKLASKAHILDEKNKLMICDFLKGEHKRKLDKKDIDVLCRSLKKVHQIKSKLKPYDLKKDFKNYKKILKDKKSKKIIKQSLKELKKLKKYKFQKALCHHDLNKQNILFHKNQVKFIDWEFACVNDLFFDLANICVEFKLNKKEQTQVLKSYFKRLKPNYTLKLTSYKLLYKNLWKLWFKALKQT